MADTNKKTYVPGKFALAVKRSRAGLGLFTLEPISKGACIIEYTGRTLSEAQEYTSRSRYLFEVTKKKTIDGAARSNRARYINHSCRPNCAVEIDEKRERVFIFAKRDIKTGEELGYDYGRAYVAAHIKPKGCVCIKCRPELHRAL